MFASIANRVTYLATTVAMISGCGAHVPEIQEFWGDKNQTEIRVNAIAWQVDCEIRESIRYLVAGTSGRLDFLKGWGAQATLILTVQEKMSLSPGLSLISPFRGPDQTVSGGLGGTYSNDATRIDKVTFLYPLSKYYASLPTKDPAHPGYKPINCVADGGDRGSFFLYSDLKIRDWLVTAFFPEYNDAGRIADGTDKEAISHEVKFVVTTDGNVTPSWKLVRLTANTGGSPFFDASRDRTQDLQITFGPVAVDAKGKASLSTVAQSSAASSEFAGTLAAQLRTLRSF